MHIVYFSPLQTLICALCDQGQDPREQLELCQDRVRLDIHERFFPQRVVGN